MLRDMHLQFEEVMEGHGEKIGNQTKAVGELQGQLEEARREIKSLRAEATAEAVQQQRDNDELIKKMDRLVTALTQGNAGPAMTLEEFGQRGDFAQKTGIDETDIEASQTSTREEHGDEKGRAAGERKGKSGVRAPSMEVDSADGSKGNSNKDEDKDKDKDKEVDNRAGRRRAAKSGLRAVPARGERGGAARS
ncbi:hypothetical protein CPB83DRAFT_896710 [Crepidotus variabilis]|uniref:Uncharacterized protein n=1 Tax=Crepidotus variabilis TaxID=179855 RepID=A0A9P6EBB0_9AGAR|nr:hypothetical protein CPB83DRAFT_896710 [Crepidotus variabilis]